MIEVVTCWLHHPELIAGYEAAVRGARAVIVNQASDRETTAALCAMVERLGNGSTIVHLERNEHFAAGNNHGLARCTGDVVCFVNNDIVGAPHGDPERWLAAVARDVQPGGLYGPTVRAFDVDGEPHPYIEGWCIAATRTTWAGLGAWNAIDFPRAYAEDVELCWRARRSGVALYQAKWPLVHLGNRTSATMPGIHEDADRQRERFREMVRAARMKGAA